MYDVLDSERGIGLFGTKAEDPKLGGVSLWKRRQGTNQMKEIGPAALRLSVQMMSIDADTEAQGCL